MVSVWVFMSNRWVHLLLLIRVIIWTSSKLCSYKTPWEDNDILNCALCTTGERPDPEQIFRLTSLQNFSGGSGGVIPPLSISPAHTPSNNMGHRQVDTVLMETPQDTLVCLSCGFSCILLCFIRRYVCAWSVWGIVWGHIKLNLDCLLHHILALSFFSL